MELDSIFKFRIEASDKELLFKAAPEAISVSDFWRDLMLALASRLDAIRRGELEPEVLSEWVLNFAQAYKWYHSESVSPEDASKFDADWVREAGSGKFGDWPKEFALRFFVLAVYAPESSKKFEEFVKRAREQE